MHLKTVRTGSGNSLRDTSGFIQVPRAIQIGIEPGITHQKLTSLKNEASTRRCTSKKECIMTVTQKQPIAPLPTSPSISLITALSTTTPPLNPPGVPNGAPAPVLDSSGRVVQHPIPATARNGQTIIIYLSNPANAQLWTLYSVTLDQNLLSIMYKDQNGVFKWWGLWEALKNNQVPLGTYEIKVTYWTSPTSVAIVSQALTITYS